MFITQLSCILIDDPKLKIKVMNIFAAESDPFLNHRSEYSRIKTMVAMGLVEPRELAIGSRLDSTSTCTQTVATTVQYIPLKDTLQLLYRNQGFRDSLDSHQQW